MIRRVCLPSAGLARNAATGAVLATFPGSRVGRVMLVKFHADSRQEVRAGRETTWIGLGNFNFYNNHIHDTALRLSNAGYRFWSRPTTYEMSEAVGSPTEVVFEATDSVPVNLVQLIRGTRTQTGEMAAFLDSHGMTPTGFTQVVTSAHYVRDMAAAVEFHRRVLGMQPLIDEVLDRPEQNDFLRLPRDARTHVVFMKGGHMFGKVALCSAAQLRVRGSHGPRRSAEHRLPGDGLRSTRHR